ncbi:MAG: CaCA family Na(+)/Ca(+) antiporter [candidate division CPR1 bacterium GW2011_GWA2_42_17]|uniref:CaCA family Na(+)/Ca(+) antiporter n=1 Tax=candidate division CPR1 bacterium GW2011_GWA2_42_17 TaxID=1618341 RepID=A0A0G0Z5M1_9BACT|nr:MAG: CaCA family Na(+)/Ca(+) antiporter [candidate division CPR1 bacterium GW2011_GWA2_42_17]
MLFDLFFFILALVVVLICANLLVNYALKLSKLLHLSPFLVGMTILAAGTSLPELAISLLANIEGQTGLSIGNILGSNIANATLVLGLAFIFFPIRIGTRKTQRNSLLLFLITIFFAIILGFFKEITFLFGVILILLSIIVFWYQTKLVEEDELIGFEKDLGINASNKANPKEIIFLLGKFTLGSIVIFFSSHWIIQSSISLIKSLGISGEIFGLTILAIGTSLPEFFTTIIAANKKEAKLLIGNILGSNIVNLLLVGGAASLIHPLVLTNQKLLIYWLGSAGLLFLIIRKYKGTTVSKKVGVLLLTMFVFYLTWIWGLLS